MQSIVKQTVNDESPFDSIRRFDENGAEFWYARELMPLLGYQKWERFEGIIGKAKLACKNSGANWEANFYELNEQSGKTERVNYQLSRYGCYLVVINGDPRKPEIAVAQAYFAIKLIICDYLLLETMGLTMDIWGQCVHQKNKETKEGFIYLVHQSATNYYKIGKSTNPYKRMQHLQVGTPLELVIIERYFSFDCVKLEKLLHNYYEAYWIRGEWFEFSSCMINEFLSVARLLDNTVESELLPSSADLGTMGK